MGISIRPATLDDAATMAETVHLGFASYRAFLPAGWAPPTRDDELARIRRQLPLPDAWARVAEDDGVPAGHVAFLAAHEDAPELAHLWMLFVREPWWGTGLAGRLHGLALAAAARQGYEAMRLFTPAGQARARTFYEREGWALHAGPRWEPMLALDLVEYRRALG